ncbi:MAG: DevR family CRISPR-associated autoregulator, partial [Nitrososphaerales archaeon]
GNVSDIRIMEFLNQEGKKEEAAAISGRMLKHWHYEAMRKLGREQNLPFCDSCKIGEPVRPAKLKSNGNLSHQEAIDKGAVEVVKECSICDIHGFLAAIGTTSERRSSRAMFSWLMPVISISPEELTSVLPKQVIHSRVKSGKAFEEQDLTSQMPFSKSYASGVYAFVSALDVERIGLVELNLGSANPYAVDDSNGRKARIKVAIEAYRYLISGQMGASLSHAMPHGNPVEILVAYSESGPLPFPVSPMYSDYIAKTKGLMPQGTTLLYWGDIDKPEGITKKDNIDDLFTELLQKVDEKT